MSSTASESSSTSPSTIPTSSVVSASDSSSQSAGSDVSPLSMTSSFSDISGSGSTSQSRGTEPSTLSDGGTIASSSNSKSVVAVPVLGAVLGIVIVVCVIIMALLWRRIRRLRREATNQDEAGQRQIDSEYHLYGKESTFGAEADPQQLRQQLADVRKELAAISVLNPSTIRDQSDYMRDLLLLNDGVRQLAMRVCSKRQEPSAVAVRSAICSALWSHIFDKFDAGLDEDLEKHLSTLANHLKRPATSTLWRAITVESLPLADHATLRHKIEAELLDRHGQLLQPGATADIVKTSIELARALAADGKGYYVTYSPGQPSMGLNSGSQIVVYKP